MIASLESEEAFAGYWQRPDADARALKQGWYFTGDVGYCDADGDLFVTGRVDDMIISGGENVLPAEIESVLSVHPAVAEAAVAGLADERWGQKVAAFVVRGRPGGRSRARRPLPRVGAGRFQAATDVRLRPRDPEVPGGQGAAAPPDRGRVRRGR